MSAHKDRERKLAMKATFLQDNDTAKSLTEKQVARAVEPLKTKIWVGISPAKVVCGDLWHGYTKSGLAKQRKSKIEKDCHIYSQYSMQIVDTKTVILTNNESSLTVFSFNSKLERNAFLKEILRDCIAEL